MKSAALVLVLVMVVSFVASDVFAGDGKYYSEFALKHKVNDKFDVFFTPEMRLNDDMGNLYYYSLRGGATYHAHKNLDLSLASRFLQTKDSKGKWDTDTYYVPEMIIIPKVTVRGFNLSDANKFEYRVIENATDRWVYRNLATIAYPTKIGNFEFTPYVSDEIYYDFEINKMNLNWATIGANKKITKNLTVGLYYRNEASRKGVTSTWVTNNILGSNITIDF
ncbi:MAG: DUF2490 domain-containing protein [Candidatus Omnitrophota bacterium]|nr:DUF2490 domain-containing protein [Candidatus Omnitrophota bacterium]